MLQNDEEFFQKYSDTPINKLQIIGSHDTAAYQLIGGSSNKWINLANIGRWFIPGVDGFIKDWTLTQENTIIKQLTKGIRAFDLRVTYYKGQFYFTHTFFCVPAEDALTQINDYVKTNANCFVLLIFKPDWEYRQTFDAVAFRSLIRRTIDENYWIKKVNTGGFPTLKECLSQGQHLLCGFTEEYGLQEDWIWGAEYFYGKWIQDLNDESFYQEVKNFVNTTTNSRINHIPLVKTPTADVIKQDIVNRLKFWSYKPQSIKIWSQFSHHVLSRLAEDQVDTSSVSIFWLDYV